MAKLSKYRLIRFSSPYFNIETGLAGFAMAFAVLLINWVGTGIWVWGAAVFRLVFSLVLNLLFPKLGEHLARRGTSPFRRQVLGNLVPTTLGAAIQILVFLWMGIPRPFMSVLPFWLVALVTFTQIVKYAAQGYEPGVLDIVHGLWNDLKKMLKKK